VGLAAGAGVTTLALTDHDTVAGLDEAVAAGRERGVRVVPGIELSVRVSNLGMGSMHLLGYFRTTAPSPLVQRLAELAAKRVRRARAMVERLAQLGAPISFADVAARAGGTIGRPHLADALVAAGHAETPQDAFERFLADGAPAYVPQDGLEPEEAVRLVTASGGAAVLAHPASLAIGQGHKLEAFVRRLAAAGLSGMEVHRPDHTPERRDALARIARRVHLVAAGGSDFHRPLGPIRPGDTGVPGLPPDTLDRLLA
jgi:predicted metal-dependent phosphoesterase TrpH